MSQFYKVPRNYNLYQKDDPTPYKLSRSKIDLFKKCPRCFYYDIKKGVKQPPGFPFNINSGIDTLLKKEFDLLRDKGDSHPLIEKYGVDARPVAHEDLDTWRENFKGIRHHHRPTNFIITGAIDDLWLDNNTGEYIVVDYKATAKDGRITELNKPWHIAYKRQLEVYQWLLRQNNYEVSDTGYWVYANGNTGEDKFDGKMEFDMTLIAYDGNDEWIEPTLHDMKKLLDDEEVPPFSEECDHCCYVKALIQVSKK